MHLIQAFFPQGLLTCRQLRRAVVYPFTLCYKLKGKNPFTTITLLPPFTPYFPHHFSEVNLLVKHIPARKHLSFNIVYQPFNSVNQPFNFVYPPFNSAFQSFNFVYQSFSFVYQQFNTIFSRHVRLRECGVTFVMCFLP
jgi:hypothetical protein